VGEKFLKFVLIGFFAFANAISAGANESPSTTLVPLQHCAYGEDLNTNMIAAAVYPLLPIVLESADGTTFITPPPYPEFPPTIIGIGLLPSGLYDWLGHSFTVLNPANRAQLNYLWDVSGNDAFASGPFVAHLFVRFRVENTLNELQCAVIYWDGGDPANVADYIQNGRYIGPNPMLGLDGTWVGNGIGGPAQTMKRGEVDNSDAESANSIFVTTNNSNSRPAAAAEKKSGTGFGLSSCASSSLPTSYSGMIWLILSIFFITLWIQKRPPSVRVKTTVN